MAEVRSPDTCLDSVAAFQVVRTLVAERVVLTTKSQVPVLVDRLDLSLGDRCTHSLHCKDVAPDPLASVKEMVELMVACRQAHRIEHGSALEGHRFAPEIAGALAFGASRHCSS